MNEGTNLQLFCEASGKPTPNITWTRVLEDGSSSAVLHKGPTWNFPNINSSNAGTYRCTADNGAGRPVSHTVTFIVKCKNIIILYPEYQAFFGGVTGNAEGGKQGERKDWHIVLHLSLHPPHSTTRSSKSTTQSKSFLVIHLSHLSWCLK